LIIIIILPPKFIRSNNGPEFLLPDFYASKGIIHQRSCVETPEQNGRVERKHQHILNVGRALLFQSKLPNIFWCYAVLHSVFLTNRVSTPLLKNKSPYQVLYDYLPDIHSFKVFGCLCYASTLQAHRTKLQSRAKKYIFLGYKSGFKGSVLFDLDSRKIFVSRNVVFRELILPYSSSSPSPQTGSTFHLLPLIHLFLMTLTFHFHLHHLSHHLLHLLLPFHVSLLLHHLHQFIHLLELPLEIKLLLHIYKITYVMHLLLLMLITVIVNIFFLIFFHIHNYLTLVPFLLCPLFPTLNQNHMLRLSNMTARNKQCKMNLMLLVRLELGK